MTTSFDVALIQCLLVGLVGFLFYVLLMAAEQKQTAQLMKVTTILVIIVIIAEPIWELLQKAAAWTNNVVERFEVIADKVSDPLGFLRKGK